MATRTAIVEGERNVLITAPTNNALIVTGDRNTVEMQLQGAGAALAFVFRWNRPRPRKRGDRPCAPPCFACHVDRDAEVRVLAAEADAPRVVNLYGEAGVGKTHVLVEALNRRECEMRDGSVYLDGRERDADDLLHAIFEALFECRVPLRDLQIERHLKDRRALLALENLDLPPDHAQRLTLGLPDCRVFVTSRARVLYDAVPLKIDGLAPEHAVAIAEQELGRSLTGRERAVAESVAAGLRGHPLGLRQIFSRARDAGLPLEQLAPRAASAYDRAQALSADERLVARTLAVHGDAPLGLEHIEVLAGDRAPAAAAALEARHEARSHSPRYSLLGGLAAAFDERELGPELDRALEHFTGWCEDEARAGRRDAVLLETVALVALLERAHAAGRNDDVVRLGFAIEGALAWGNRWKAWGRVLELVLASARENGDSLAEAAALHQLGTRAYGTGDVRAARNLLEQALALRERIGDLTGAETTRRNLRVVDGRAPLLYRLSHLPLTILAFVFVLLIGAAGVAGATALGPPDGGDAVAELSIGVQGEGAVVSNDGSIRCAQRECRKQLSLQRELLLRPQPQEGWEFARWSAACSGRGACRLLMTGDTRVVAEFKRVREPRTVTVVVGRGGTVVSHPAGITCQAGDTCSGTFTRSRTVELTAAAAHGHRFVGWSRDCDDVRRCVIGGDAVVHARFAANPDAVTLSVDVRGDGVGRITSRQSGIDCGQLCTAGYRRDSRVLLTAVAQRGSRFSGWGHAACAATGSDNTCTVTLDRSRTVVARFDRLSAAPGPTSSPPTTSTAPPAQAPSVRITSPADRSVFAAGERITYVAQISDPQDAGLSSYEVSWREDGIVFGRGQLVTRDKTRPGTHSIEVTAVNDKGQSASAQITIRVDPPPQPITPSDVAPPRNRAPRVTIDAPPPDTSFVANKADKGRFYSDVQFEATATDPDGDPLTFRWTDSSKAPAEPSVQRSPLLRLYVSEEDPVSANRRTTVHEIKVTVSDGTLSTTETITVSVYYAIPP